LIIITLLIHLILNSEEIEEKELADALLTEMGKIMGKIVCKKNERKKKMVYLYELRNSKIIVSAKRASVYR